MLKKIVITLGVLLVLFVGFVASRPSQFRVERSATILAPADLIYAAIADFQQWPHWSPWEKLDPAMAKTYEGSPGTPGARYSWSGNDKVGKGMITITDLHPNEFVAYRLEFVEPWQAINSSRLTIQSAGVANTVTWTMEGQNDFVAKLFSVLMNMDEMIGKDFELGLANLNTYVTTALPKTEPTAVAALPPEESASTNVSAP